MASLHLRALLGPKTPASAVLKSVMDAMGGGVVVEDATGKRLFGTTTLTPIRLPVTVDGTTLGWVSGPEPAASATASLLTHLAASESEKRALAGEVLHLYREVHLIEELSEQLAARLELSSVGRTSLDQARRLIHATSGGIFIVDTASADWRPIDCFGTQESADWDLIASVMERGTAEIREARLCVPLKAKDRALGAIAMSDSSGTPYTAASLKLLNTIALQTASAIENSFLCAEMVDAVRDREQLSSLHKELDTARSIQLSLVPRIFPPFPDRKDFELHAQMTAASSVGGDFFDFFLIDNDHLGVVIGDVSGKGIPAALYMAITRTQIKTTALGGMPPEECLGAVNSVLMHEKASSLFATCFYGILNTRTGEFLYCNAGHNPPYLVRAASGGVLQPLASEGGLPLGLFDGRPYTGACAQLALGDGIFLFTNGVSEAINVASDSRRLEDVLLRCAQVPCEEVVRIVASEVASVTGGAPQADDITMVSLRLLGQS